MVSLHSLRIRRQSQSGFVEGDSEVDLELVEALVGMTTEER